nr:putative membrane protein [Emiliania huxleyi virus 86]
ILGSKNALPGQASLPESNTVTDPGYVADQVEKNCYKLGTEVYHKVPDREKYMRNPRQPTQVITYNGTAWQAYTTDRVAREGVVYQIITESSDALPANGDWVIMKEQPNTVSGERVPCMQ